MVGDIVKCDLCPTTWITEEFTRNKKFCNYKCKNNGRKKRLGLVQHKNNTIIEMYKESELSEPYFTGYLYISNKHLRKFRHIAKADYIIVNVHYTTQSLNQAEFDTFMRLESLLNDGGLIKYECVELKRLIKEYKDASRNL